MDVPLGQVRDQRPTAADPPKPKARVKAKAKTKGKPAVAAAKEETIKVRGMKYNMKVFFEQCIERYKELAEGFELGPAETSFIDEDKGVLNRLGLK